MIQTMRGYVLSEDAMLELRHGVNSLRCSASMAREGGAVECFTAEEIAALMDVHASHFLACLEQAMFTTDDAKVRNT